MSNSTQNETHNVCNERLAREGGQARCCDCDPHEGCTLGMKTTQQDTLQDTVQDTQNNWADRIKKIADYLGCNEGELVSEVTKLLADARREVGNGIEKMYLSVADKDPRYDTVEEIQAYNQAIYEILATLKEEL